MRHRSRRRPPAPIKPPTNPPPWWHRAARTRWWRIPRPGPSQFSRLSALLLTLLLLVRHPPCSATAYRWTESFRFSYFLVGLPSFVLLSVCSETYRLVCTSCYPACVFVLFFRCLHFVFYRTLVCGLSGQGKYPVEGRQTAESRIIRRLHPTHHPPTRNTRSILCHIMWQNSVTFEIMLA